MDFSGKRCTLMVAFYQVLQVRQMGNETEVRGDHNNGTIVVEWYRITVRAREQYSVRLLAYSSPRQSVGPSLTTLNH